GVAMDTHRVAFVADGQVGVYTYSESDWVLEQNIINSLPDDGWAALALDGDQLIVSTAWSDVLDTPADGTATIYGYTDGEWVLEM
ncbi:MAG: hypothetical protein ABGY75_14790, partial [Gemmataceae bacterium]